MLSRARTAGVLSMETSMSLPKVTIYIYTYRTLCRDSPGSVFSDLVCQFHSGFSLSCTVIIAPLRILLVVFEKKCTTLIPAY